MSMARGIIDNPALLDGWIAMGPASPGDETFTVAQAWAEAHTALAKHRYAMEPMGSDRRIRYLAEQGLDDARIRELLGDIQSVVNRDQGETIRETAARHARKGNSLLDVVKDLSKTGVIQDLAAVCIQGDGETDVVAVAYALHEFCDTVNANLNVAMIAQEQLDDDPAYDPQYTERDRILADVGLAEDANLWPKS